MAEEAATTTDAPTEDAPTTEEKTEDSVSRERYLSLSKNKKVAEDRAKALEKDLAELRAQMEERETAGLPELERERKRAEQLEKRAAAAEERADKQERAAVTAGRKSLVLAAAAAAGFDEADDALRYPEHVNLDEIESAAEAERAVKRLAKAKPRLLKAEEPKLPGQVLRNGRPADRGPGDPAQAQRENEGQTILEGIRNLQRGWQSGGTL